jgi:hypothetical protein
MFTDDTNSISRFRVTHAPGNGRAARKPPGGARPMMVTARWSGGYNVQQVSSLSEGTGDGQKVSGNFREVQVKFSPAANQIPIARQLSLTCLNWVIGIPSD